MDKNKLRFCCECSHSDKMFNGWVDTLCCKFNDVDPVTKETSVFRQTYPECKNVNVFGDCSRWKER